MLWAIERGTFWRDEEERLIAALADRDLAWVEFQGVAFRNDAEIQSATGPRGSCFFIRQASGWPGWRSDLWGNPDDYDCAHYYPRFAGHLLNAEARMLTINEFLWRAVDVAEELSAGESLFIRPTDGFKSFEGGVVSLADRDAWRESVALLQVPMSTPILVARPTTLVREWRVVLVSGHAVAASEYRPTWNGAVPADVLRYAEAVHAETHWPAKAYVMDIAETAGNLRVIEIGCLLCVAFYEVRPGAIVDAICELLGDSR